MAITIKQRAYAGMWFMAAGIVPVLYVSSLFLSFPSGFSGEQNSLDVEFALWFMIIPLLITGMMGSLFGASILDTQKVRSGWRAALRGLLVAIVAFLLSTVLISVWIASDEYQSFVPTLIMMFGVGLMVVGWLVAITGVFAGWLLYQRQASKRDKPSSS